MRRWAQPCNSPTSCRDQLAGSGIPPSTYVASGGLNPRADIAGLNLAQFPSVLVELGNMKNPADSALMKTPEGPQKYADAVVRGIAASSELRPTRSRTLGVRCRAAYRPSTSFLRFSSTSP
jgi:hypothetical protein